MLAALYLGMPVRVPLAWARYPRLPIAAAVAVAVLAARRTRRPPRGWDAFLAFATSAVLLRCAGMLLIQCCTR